MIHAFTSSDVFLQLGSINRVAALKRFPYKKMYEGFTGTRGGGEHSVACRTGGIFCVFRRTEAKARRARNVSRARGAERKKKINAYPHTII